MMYFFFNSQRCNLALVGPFRAVEVTWWSSCQPISPPQPSHWSTSQSQLLPRGKLIAPPKNSLFWYDILETRWYQRKKNFNFLHMILLHIFWFEIFDLMDILIKWHCIFLVQGLSNEFDTVGSNLGNFTYNESGPPLQTFSIKVTK